MNTKDGFPGYKEHVIRTAGEAKGDQFGLQPDGTFRVRGNLNDATPPAQAMKASAGKAMLHLLPPAALIEVARVREYGAAKYAPWDWTLGRNWTDYYDAVLRHMLEWHTGQDKDHESGLSNLAMACCTLMFMIEFEKSKKGLDNRPSGLLVDIASEKR